MDLQNGFFHVAVEEASKPYTAFVTREGLFEFNKAPFGFKNSPAAFIRKKLGKQEGYVTWSKAEGWQQPGWQRC